MQAHLTVIRRTDRSYVDTVLQILNFYKAQKMAWIFLRHKVFYNQLKRLHTSVVCNTPTFNFLNEKKAFEAVWPEVIDCLMTRSKLTPQPEVGSWVKQVS